MIKNSSEYLDVKELVEFVLEYGKDNSLPNMEGSGEAAYQAALRLQQHGLLNAIYKEPTGHMTEEQLFQNLYRMVAGTNVTYKQVDSDLDEKGDVTIFFTIHPNLKGDNNAKV